MLISLRTIEVSYPCHSITHGAFVTNCHSCLLSLLANIPMLILAEILRSVLWCNMWISSLSQAADSSKSVLSCIALWQVSRECHSLRMQHSQPDLQEVLLGWHLFLCWGGQERSIGALRQEGGAASADTVVWILSAPLWKWGCCVLHWVNNF